MLGDLPTPVQSADEKVLLVGGEWSFPELRNFVRDSIDSVLYKTIMSSSPQLEKVELRKMDNVWENVLLHVPSCVHQLQAFYLSTTHGSPGILLPSLLHLKNLKKLPSLRYEGYDDGHHLEQLKPKLGSQIILKLWESSLPSRNAVVC